MKDDYIKFINKTNYNSKTPKDFLIKNNLNKIYSEPIKILNKQIINLYEKISPKDFEKRKEAVKELNKIIQIFIKNKIDLEIFGSVASMNYLPSSDIDVRIKIDFEFKNIEQINIFLLKINKNLLQENISSIFISAKVPILKILFLNYKFDLSISNFLGSNNHTNIFLKSYKEIKGLKELHLLLKQYLKNRNISLCNLVQFVLCYNFLYFYPINCDIKNNIGIIFMDFFYYFGISLNKKNFYLKFSIKNYEKSDEFFIIDPLNNNLIPFNFNFIQQSFFHSFRIMDLSLKEFKNNCNEDIDFISLWFRE